MPKKVNETQDHGLYARIINLPAAGSSTEPVRLAEFQAALAGLDFIEQPVRVVEASAITVANPPATIDGVNVNTGDRILLTAQATASENGIYLYEGPGAALQRSGDTYVAGSVVVAGPDGSTYGKSLWLQTTDNPVVGTTALTFSQFGTTISAGTGITTSGGVVALITPVAIANGGTGASSAAAARANLGAPGVYSAQFGDGSSTSFTINHNLGNKFCAVVVTNLSTNQDEECTITRNSANQLVLSSEAWAAQAPAANAYEVCCIG